MQLCGMSAPYRYPYLYSQHSQQQLVVCYSVLG